MKRLIDETNDPLEQAVLREGRDYRASKRARDLALAAIVKPSWFKSLGFKMAVGAIGIGAIGALWFSWKNPALAPSNDATTTHDVTPVIATAPVAIDSMPAVPSPPAVTQIAPSVVAKPLPTARSQASSSLAEEIAAIDRARKAVYDSDKAGAIRALDDYDRRFPNGAFAPEAKTLRARAGALP